MGSPWLLLARGQWHKFAHSNTVTLPTPTRARNRTIPAESTGSAGKVAIEKEKGTCEMLIELRPTLRGEEREQATYRPVGPPPPSTGVLAVEERLSGQHTLWSMPGHLSFTHMGLNTKHQYTLRFYLVHVAHLCVQSSCTITNEDTLKALLRGRLHWFFTISAEWNSLQCLSVVGCEVLRFRNISRVWKVWIAGKDT